MLGSGKFLSFKKFRYYTTCLRYLSCIEKESLHIEDEGQNEKCIVAYNGILNLHCSNFLSWTKKEKSLMWKFGDE